MRKQPTPCPVFVDGRLRPGILISKVGSRCASRLASHAGRDKEAVVKSDDVLTFIAKLAGVALLVIAVLAFGALLLDTIFFRADFDRRLAETIREALGPLDETYAASRDRLAASLGAVEAEIERLGLARAAAENIRDRISELREEIDEIIAGAPRPTDTR